VQLKTVSSVCVFVKNSPCSGYVDNQPTNQHKSLTCSTVSLHVGALASTNSKTLEGGKKAHVIANAFSKSYLFSSLKRIKRFTSTPAFSKHFVIRAGKGLQNDAISFPDSCMF